MSRRPAHHKLVGRLVLETELGAFLGDTRIRLLEAIDRHGSISHAAKTIPLSYKAAWDAVDAMNNVADEPLVQRSVGGQGGGGTTLTDYGRRMVAFYRAMEEDYQGVLDRVAKKLGKDGAGDIQQYRSLIRRIAMNTSARNQFVGPVSALREGAVNFEVCLRIDQNNELTAIITNESAQRLGLAIGKEVQAYVKASSVILATDPDLRTSADNQFRGTVARVHSGAVNDEVTLLLPGGRNIVSVITHESVGRIGIVEGTAAYALFKASSVILATLG